MREAQYFSLYRHYEGKYCYVIGSAWHTETSELLVIYHDLDSESETHAEPEEKFLDEVEDDVYNPTNQKYRFELVFNNNNFNR